MKTVSIKLVNFLTLVLSTVFFMLASFEVVFLQTQANKIETEFNNMLNEIQLFNYNHLKGFADNSIKLPPQNIMFDNGTDAFLYAYRQFMTANTYHLVINGQMVNSVLGITIKTNTKNIIIKFEDGSILYELIAYEEGNAYQRTGSQMIYYEKQKERVYINFTTNVIKTNNDLIPIYEQGWLYQTVSEFARRTGIVPGSDMFNFTKRTIVSETYFKKTIIKDEVREYQTQLITDAARAGEPYTKIIAYVAQATEPPVIKDLKINAVIDKDGALKYINVVEKFTLKTKIPVLGDKVVACEADSIYQFITIGGQILAEKPNVSNANPW